MSGIVDKLHADEYKTIDEYLQTSYDDSFIGELYNLQKQGVPVVFPIDQKAAVRAILTNSKLSAGLYARLGIDLQQMKTDVSREITRGIASSMPYKDIARNIKNVSGVSMGRAKTIARTEGHRIQEASRSDAQHRAKNIGADVVKQWDSALDGKTRDTHRQLDGQIREIDDPFEVDGKKAMYPGEFGRPEEDINCRCRSNTRARWALSANETKHLGNVEDMSFEQKQAIANKLKVPVDELDKYSGQIVPIKAKDYEDFKRQYGEYWHYEGSDLQKEAESRIAGYKTNGKSGKAVSSANSGVAKAGKVEANGRFVNNQEKLYRYAEKVKPIDGYEDFTCHANASEFYIDTKGNGNKDDFVTLSPKEYAEAIRNSKTYKGGNVRIISCQAGAESNGAAQQLANALNVSVLAPTEVVNIDENGEMFISDNDILSELWYNATVEERAKFKETGSWIVFKPRKE